jgi:hypothetical protein
MTEHDARFGLHRSFHLGTSLRNEYLGLRSETRHAMECSWGSSAGGIRDSTFGGTVYASAAIRLTEPAESSCRGRSALQRAEDAVAFTKAVANRKRNQVRAGHSASAIVEILPRALRAFQRTNPHVRVELRATSTEDMPRALRSGDLDVSLLVYGLPEDFQGLAVKELGAYPLRVAAHKKHRFAWLREVLCVRLSTSRLSPFSRRRSPGNVRCSPSCCCRTPAPSKSWRNATTRISSFGMCSKRVKRRLSSIRAMVTFLLGMLAYARAFLIAQHSLAMETTALGQQLAVYKRK